MDDFKTHPHYIKLLFRLRILFGVVIALAFISFFASYQYLNKTPAIESIRDFDVKLAVQTNGDILVTESIAYDFDYNNKKGMSRYIPLTNGDKKRLDIEVIGVVDELGQPYKYEAYLIENDVMAIRIGDPDFMVSGLKIYKISYKVKNIIEAVNGARRLYWNVTGDQWPLEIKSATATVVLPDPKAKIISTDCFTGPRGTKESTCNGIVSETSELEGTLDVLFSTSRSLMNIEGFTIVLNYRADY